jgi:hypothetical protein
MEWQADLCGSNTGFTSHSLLPCVWYQSCYHLAKKSKMRTPCTRLPWVVASLSVASAILLLLKSTWPGIHTNVILQSCLESAWQVVHSCKMSRWVKSRHCRLWIALRKSVCRRNFLGRRLPTTWSALQSARSFEINIELKEFSQNLKRLNLKKNAQPVDPFITDPSEKTKVWSA